jgi:hypothetical protein
LIPEDDVRKLPLLVSLLSSWHTAAVHGMSLVELSLSLSPLDLLEAKISTSCLISGMLILNYLQSSCCSPASSCLGEPCRRDSRTVCPCRCGIAWDRLDMRPYLKGDVYTQLVVCTFSDIVHR